MEVEIVNSLRNRIESYLDSLASCAINLPLSGNRPATMPLIAKPTAPEAKGFWVSSLEVRSVRKGIQNAGLSQKRKMYCCLCYRLINMDSMLSAARNFSSA